MKVIQTALFSKDNYFNLQYFISCGILQTMQNHVPKV